MKAGYGKSELTPPLGVELAGYGYYLQRRAQKVLDPLYARALYLEEEQEKVLLVSCDLLGLNRDIVQDVRRGLEQKGIRHLILVSIHTHTGPATVYHEGCGELDAQYPKTVAGIILAACEAAVNSAAQVTALEGICAPLTGKFIYNRACEDGPVDQTVRGYIVRRKGEKPISVVSCACHAVSRGRIPFISADYPGRLNQLMEQAGYNSLYINGLCGDIDPWVEPGEDRDTRLETFAEQLQHTFLDKSTPLPLSLYASRMPFTLSLQHVTKEEIRKTASSAVARQGSEEAPAAKVARKWENEMLGKFDGLSFEERVEVSYLLLGGRLIVALPFEGFTQIGVHLREKLHAPESIVLGCAEQLLGYLPTRDDIARGSYAALESTFLYKRLPFAPGAAEQLSDELANALQGQRSNG